ncbi:MAG: hypothetical protein HY908_00915 [Myxococcales bacterium]|nr:hypothetical protein [Myxococcales bacterium]
MSLHNPGRSARSVLALCTAALVGAGCASDPPPKPRTTHDALEPAPDSTAVAEVVPDEGEELSMDGSPHGGVAIATLPGFRTFADGSSRAFVEVSAHVPITEVDGTVKVTFRLKGVRVPDRVNRMGMPSSYFDRSPVSRVHLEQIGDDAEFIIELRQPVAPKTSVHRTPFGTRLVVWFPPLRPDEHDTHYRAADDVRFGYDVTHRHGPYGEENRRLVHDHEGRLRSSTATSLGTTDAAR